MRTLNELKRDRYVLMHGPLSVDEALQLALESEEHAKAVDPFDPAVTYFYQKMQDYLEHAAALEQTQNEEANNHSQAR